MNAFETLVFLGLPKVGRKTVKKIIDRYQEGIELSNPIDYRNVVSEISEKIANNITIEKIEQSMYRATTILEDSKAKEITSIAFSDKLYPELLRDLGNDAPVILFARGDISVLDDKNKVAVIGTRNNTANADKAGRHITKQLVEKGHVIVSGLAIGCDTIAHQACLDAGGKTIAVMAGGLDSIYPKQNIQLAKQIEVNGCLLSEYPIGTKSLANFFVERDRIQSGLSLGVVVIETGIKSGTMHTVKFGTNQGRSIACINYREGVALPSNEGNRMLINEGRAFALSSDNIETYINTFKGVPYSPEEKQSFTQKTSEYSPVDNKEVNKSTVFDSNPELMKKKDENVQRIKSINKSLEKLTNEVIRIGGSTGGQISMFEDNDDTQYAVDTLKKDIKSLTVEKTILIEENKQLLDTIKNNSKDAGNI